MDELILTYEQLYFLGEILKAKYIDYRYIKAMQDIQKQYIYLKNKNISELLGAGVLQEDFSGNLKVLPVYEALLSPIFFGEEETCVETSDGQAYLFHQKEGEQTAVAVVENQLHIRPIKDIFAETSSILKKIFVAQKVVDISCKYAKIGVGGVEQQLSAEEKGIYVKDEHGKQRPVTADEAINLVLDTWLRGGFSYEL